MHALISGIFVRADIRVGPAIKRALLNVSEIVGHKVISQGVSLLHRGPESIRAGIPPEPDGIASSGSEDLMAGAVRVVSVNCRAARIFARRDVRARADAD